MNDRAILYDNLHFKTEDAAHRFVEDINRLGYCFYQYNQDVYSDTRYVPYRDEKAFDNLMKQYAPDMMDDSSLMFFEENDCYSKYLIDNGNCIIAGGLMTDLYMCVIKNQNIIGIVKGDSITQMKKKLAEQHIDFDEIRYLESMKTMI
jgi:hypothetical protein